MSDISALVLHERREPEAAQIAAELERILDVHDEPEPSAAIALPVGDALAVGLDRADVVVALDAPSLARAREAGARVCVALCPYLGVVWDATLADADLVLVTHDALVDDAVDLGARRERVRVVGPIAPDGYAPPSDRASLRRELGLDPERPVVLVRATALDRIDQPVALVQLSLVAQQVQFLFDVGRDVDRAMSLRRTVPGYGIDAWIFAETDDAPRAWGAADLVLGTIGGPETARALAVGAPLVLVPPRARELRAVHALEAEGLVEAADAAATLAVSLDSALRPEHLERARALIAKLAPAEGAARTAAALVALVRQGPPIPSGLPAGLERIGEAGERKLPAPPAPSRDDVDRKIDAELEALRKKLGLGS